MAPGAVVEKYFGDRVVRRVTDVTTLDIVVYTNDTRKAVNTHVFRKLLQKKELQPGQPLVLKGYIKGMCKNYVYTLKRRRADGGACVVDSKGSRTRVNATQFAMFELPYATTCHAKQGLTMSKPFTIFDADESFVTARWLWTAITRARWLQDITFCLLGTSGITRCKLRRQITHKLESYRATDEAKGQWSKQQFITAEWVQAQLEQQAYTCCHCATSLTLHDTRTQWSVDRIDNALGHVRHNCEVRCFSCNAAKH